MKIVRSLRIAGMSSENEDVIVSGDVGYHLSHRLGVQCIEEPMARDTPTRDTNRDVPNVPKDSVPNVPKDSVPDVPNGGVPNAPDSSPKTRRAWILQQMEAGRQLRVADVVSQFKCSDKTAKRDLAALRKKGRIEFTGPNATGHYRLCPGSKTKS